jgi:hypothetical protein
MLTLKEVSMKKYKPFIFLSIITLIFIFGVAATCSLCGVPIDIGETDETEYIEAKEDSTDKVEEETAVSKEKEGTEETAEDISSEEMIVKDTAEPGSEEDREGGEESEPSDEPDTVDDEMLAEAEIFGDGGDWETVVTLYPTDSSGFIVTDGPRVIDQGVFVVGDDKTDRHIYSYMSFFLGDIMDVEIRSATLHIENISEIYGAREYGPLQIDISWTAEVVELVPTEGGLTEIHSSNPVLKDTVNYIKSTGYRYFAMTVELVGVMEGRSNNGIADQFSFPIDDVRLVVSY